MTAAEVEAIYAANAAEVRRLASLERITAEEIGGKHRHVQYAVACDYWEICDEGARSVLLNAHHHVASAAQISAEG